MALVKVIQGLLHLLPDAQSIESGRTAGIWNDLQRLTEMVTQALNMLLKCYAMENSQHVPFVLPSCVF